MTRNLTDHQLILLVSLVEWRQVKNTSVWTGAAGRNVERNSLDCVLRERGGGEWSGDLMIADYEDLSQSEASEICIKRFKSQEVLVKEHQEFLCANETLGLLNRPRPSLLAVLAEGNLEPERDVEIEEDGKKREANHKIRGPRVETLSCDITKNLVSSILIQVMNIPDPIEIRRRNETSSDEFHNVSGDIINGMWTETNGFTLLEGLTGTARFQILRGSFLKDTNGLMEDLRKFKRPPDQTVHDLILGHIYPRNKQKIHDRVGRRKCQTASSTP